MSGPNKIHRQRTWKPEKPLGTPGTENLHPDQPIPKSSTSSSHRLLSRFTGKNVAMSITIFGFCIGFGYETILTFFKIPGGETFYDFQRRKLGRDRYEQEPGS